MPNDSLTQPLGQPAGRPAGGHLVLLRSSDGRAWRRLPVEPHDELCFGRERDSRPGILDPLEGTEPDPTLSRRHALLAFEHGQAHLLDLGSTNGTWLNSRRLPAHVPTPLENGDLLRMGSRSFIWLEGRVRGSGLRSADDLDRRRTTLVDFETYGRSLLERAQAEGRTFALGVVREHGLAPEDVDEPAWVFLMSLDDLLVRLDDGTWAALLWGVDAREAHVWSALVAEVASVVPRADGRRHAVEPAVGLALASGRGHLRLMATGECLTADVSGVRRLLAHAQAECQTAVAGVGLEGDQDEMPASWSA